MTDTTVDFLSELYGELSGEWLTVFAIDRGNSNRITEWADTPAALAENAAGLEPYCCVWFGVATRRQKLGRGKRGGVNDCESLPALWVDLDVAGPNHKDSTRLPADIPAAQHLLDTFGLTPTYTVHTGGGLQAFWLFKRLEPVGGLLGVADLAERWGQTWHAHAGNAGYHVDSVFNIDRVMRLPGTTNRKNGGAQPVTILDRQDIRYTPDTIAVHLAASHTPTVAPAAAERPQRERHDDHELPGDAYNRQVDAGSILLGLGWTYAHGDSNGDRHYARPGKDAREGASATVYADGHATIWSDTVAQQYPTVEVRQGYDPFGLFARLLHRGDYRAASDALADAGYGTKTTPQNRDIFALDEKATDDTAMAASDPAPDHSVLADDAADTETVDENADLPAPINWPDFWNEEHADAEWLVEPFIARGRSHVLYAPAKAGKSLVMLEVGAALAAGRPVLWRPGGQALDVVYVDYEMTESDVQERLVDMGYGPDDDLSRLHYYLIPNMPPLDTIQGGRILARLAERDGAALVVLDTTGRAVGGEENDADTIRDFYRFTGARLKRRGVTVVRLDHAGKDSEKGQRGTSAKNDDVDVVWRLTVTDADVTLKATHRRINWLPPEMKLTRVDDPHLHHDIGPRQWPDGTSQTVIELDRLGLPLDVSINKAMAALKAAGVARGRNVIAAALRWRRERPASDL